MFVSRYKIKYIRDCLYYYLSIIYIYSYVIWSVSCVYVPLYDCRSRQRLILLSIYVQHCMICIGGSVERSTIDAYYNGGKACTPKVDCPVALGCDGGKFLSAVTSCWDQNLEQIPCNSYVLSEDNCPTSGDVYIDAWNVQGTHQHSLSEIKRH